MEYAVKQLARIAGVSVHTLQYYDQVGLLKPVADGLTVAIVSTTKRRPYHCGKSSSLESLFSAGRESETS